MSKLYTILIFAMLACMLPAGCENGWDEEITPEKTTETPAVTIVVFPKIASWLAQKEELISSGKPFDMVMTSFVTPEEAEALKANNPDVEIYAGLTTNWILAQEGWMKFLTTVASYGRETPFEIKESMFLRDEEGGRCAFGWASEEWGHEEIYAMDPRNAEWVELIVVFYKNVLDQPQHDGIIVDMVIEKAWCPGSISDEEWVAATRDIMARIREVNTQNKPVIFNSGRDLSEIDEYGDFMDGYVMENCLGEQFGASFDEGLAAADGEYTVIYAVDTDDTGIKDVNRMRLGLTLSLLNDNTFVAYDIGPRDHGDAWWFPEYDAELGLPLGKYYKQDNGYRREFEKGTVVCAPHEDVNISFTEARTDVSTGQRGTSFTVNKGDGRIFVR